MTTADTSLRYRLRRNLGRSLPPESDEEAPESPPESAGPEAISLPPLILSQDARIYPETDARPTPVVRFPVESTQDHTPASEPFILPAAQPAETQTTLHPDTPARQAVLPDEVMRTHPLPPRYRADPPHEPADVQAEARGGLRLSSVLSGFLIFVCLPTALASWYFHAIATPIYVTESAFFVSRADAPADSATRAATDQYVQTDAAALQGVLQSRPAMVRLIEEEGFAAHFQADHLDPFRRLPADATSEDMARHYARHVRVDRDLAHGVLRLAVLATTPEDSVRFAQALIGLAQDHVSTISAALRDAAVSGAMAELQEAQAALVAARQARAQVAEQAQTIEQVPASILAAETEVETWEEMRAQAIRNLEIVRRDMAREARHLVVTVAPLTPESSATPRPLEYSVLVFALFLGLFLLGGGLVVLLRKLVTR